MDDGLWQPGSTVMYVRREAHQKQSLWFGIQELFQIEGWDDLYE